MQCGEIKSSTNWFQVKYVAVEAQFHAPIVDRRRDAIVRGRRPDKLHRQADKVVFSTRGLHCLFTS